MPLPKGAGAPPDEFAICIKPFAAMFEAPIITPQNTVLIKPITVSSFTIPKIIGKEIVDSGYEYNYIFKDGAPISNSPVIISPNGQEATSSKLILSKIAKSETITSLIMPINPHDSKIIFFSTAAGPGINRIYVVNLNTAELTKIYEEESQDNSPMKTRGSTFPRILRTVGLDGSKLIIMSDDPDNSPGMCTSIWYHYQT